MKYKVEVRAPGERQSILTERRRLKMARSAHAYVRGSTIEFYQWLGSSNSKSLPRGPSIWICGDCHLGNLGPVANAKGTVRIAIRDLDQTVIGNPAHDLVRLALSMATAIRGSDLPGVTAALMLEQMMDGYENALIDVAKIDSRSHYPQSVKRILKKAVKRRWHHLAEERIEDVKPIIPLGERYWPVSKKEKKEIILICETTEVRRLITALKGRKSDDSVEVLDAAYWMKGCSSLGRLRFAVLIGVGNKKKRVFCLLDIKEAAAAAAPHSPNSGMTHDNARRVVEGALQLSPFLGKRMLPSTFLGRPVVLRELLPQDLKLEMDQLTREEAIDAARFLASVVGKAHGQQMDKKTRAKWRADLLRSHSKKLDAPSWLWTSVVQLVAAHETAYLEHCREYAMQT